MYPATKRFAEVFSVDQAFKLGDFYVTVTFRNPILINKEGTHPRNSYWSRINSTEEAAFVIYFPSSLKSIEPSSIDLKTFGTDEESNIIDAFIQEFPSAYSMLQTF